ncbi:MAG: histidinol dehydrogenase [Puniceicoccaceae bacterium]
MTTIRFRPEDFGEGLRQFLDSVAPAIPVAEVVQPILEAVRRDGDGALAALTERFDGARVGADRLRVPAEALAEARDAISDEEMALIGEAMANVRSFHERTVPKGWKEKNQHGGMVGERYYPLQRVGLYVPGGQVPLLSTVLMTALPAKVAGVPSVAVCTPPDRDGEVDAKLLGVMALCGIDEVYRVGGAQAIAAMAYGTETIPAVDKVFGPGNAYVMEAKRQVYGVVGVDLLPGPSEVMVIADEGARPDWVAADLLAQAEHGSGKEIIYLVTWNEGLVARVERELETRVGDLPNRGVIERTLRDRYLAVECGTVEEAAAVANLVAPEHLELQVEGSVAEQLQLLIKTAGAFLVGYHCPTVIGDFAAGPSHTLPTGQAGRFSSGLQVVDFMRRSSVVEYGKEAAEKVWPVVEFFGAAERLGAHAESLRLRVKPGEKS